MNHIADVPQEILAESAERRLPKELGDEFVAPYDVDLVLLDGAASTCYRISNLVSGFEIRVDDVASRYSSSVHVRAALRARCYGRQVFWIHRGWNSRSVYNA